MTVYAVYQTANRALVSVGSVVADPLPAGLAALALSVTDGQGLRDGTKTWDAVTLACVAIPIDPSQANATTIESRAAQAITDLSTIANSTGTLTALQLSNAVRMLATVLRSTVRYQFNRLNSAD